LRIGKTNIVALELPEKKHVEVEGEAVALPIKAKGKYERGETARWQVFIESKDAPLMPLETWKKMSAETISTTTSTKVTESDISLSTTTTPPWQLCLKCGNPITDVSSKYCSNCGAKLK
jgi:hypothetical protein